MTVCIGCNNSVLSVLPVCITVYYSVLQCTTVYYSVLQCTAVYYSVLQCITVYYSVLQCTAVYYSVRHTHVTSHMLHHTFVIMTIVLQHILQKQKQAATPTEPPTTTKVCTCMFCVGSPPSLNEHLLVYTSKQTFPSSFL